MKLPAVNNFFLAIATFTLLFQFANAQTVPDFNLKNVDGKQVSLSDYSSKKAVVVVFTGNHCVYSKKYEDRLIQLHQKYSASGVQVLLINSNNPAASEDEAFDQMAARAKEKNYPFPYMEDSDGKTAVSFGAVKNPESFLLVPAEGGFKLIYKGNIDDNALMADKVSQKFLENAIEMIVGGKEPSTTSTETIGCAIRKF